MKRVSAVILIYRGFLRGMLRGNESEIKGRNLAIDFRVPVEFVLSIHHSSVQCWNTTVLITSPWNIERHWPILSKIFWGCFCFFVLGFCFVLVLFLFCFGFFGFYVFCCFVLLDFLLSPHVNKKNCCVWKPPVPKCFFRKETDLSLKKR